MGRLYPFDDADRELTEANNELHRQMEALKQGGGGGMSGGMDTVDAKIAAAEARTDTKFAELRGDLNAQFGEIKTQLASKAGTGTVIGTGLGLFAAVAALIAFGGDRFDAGLGMSDVRQAQLERDQRQDAKLDEILKRLPPAK